MVVYARKEDISCEHLLIVDRGLIARNGNIGMTVVGEDMIVAQRFMRDQTTATALTSLVKCSRIARGDLDDLLPLFPMARKCIRKAAIVITFRNSILKASKFAKQQRQESFAKKLPFSSLFEAFQKFAQTAQEDVHSFEIKTPVEKRMSEIDSKVNELHRTVNSRFDELIASLGAGKKLSAANRKLAKANKSVPPPLPRGWC